LAGNILLDLFLYVHMFCSPVAREIIRRLILLPLARAGAPQAVVAWGLFRIPEGLKCVEHRGAGIAAGVHAPQAEFTFRTYCRQFGSYPETGF